MTNFENQIDDLAAKWAGAYAGARMGYEAAHWHYIETCKALESGFDYDYFCERWDEVSGDAIEQYNEHQEYLADQDY